LRTKLIPRFCGYIRVRNVVTFCLITIFVLIGHSAAQGVYYTYQGNATPNLFVGGEIHFPKSLADRVKVVGGVVLNETEKEWVIRATSETVNVEYVKLSDKDFSYRKRTFVAKEYPAEIYNPVKPDEMRLTLIQVNKNYLNLTKELDSLKLAVKTIEGRPTIGEELKGFLLYFPVMWVVYVFVGVLSFIALIGWWYERD